MDKIDFVLPWVDGSDSAWIKQRNEYLGIKMTRHRTADFGTGKICSTGSEVLKICSMGESYIFCDMGAYPFLAEYRSSEADSCKTRGLYSEAVSAHIQQSSH